MSVLDQVVELAVEKPRTYTKIEICIWHGKVDAAEYWINYVDAVTATTARGPDLETAYAELCRKLATGEE